MLRLFDYIRTLRLKYIKGISELVYSYVCSLSFISALFLVHIIVRLLFGRFLVVYRKFLNSDTKYILCQFHLILLIDISRQLKALYGCQ